MSFVTVTVDFTAKPGQAEALNAALSQAIQGTIAKEGCWEAILTRDQDDDHKFLMVQKWQSADDHKAYVDGVMNDPKMQEVMALMVDVPVSRYFDQTAQGGGDWGGPAHLELSTTDQAATTAFLEKVFHWRFMQWMEDYTGFWAPGALMGGIRPKMDEEPAAQTIPYLIVDDLETYLQAVTDNGGTVTVPIQEVPGAGRFFWFIAPGGLPLAAWQSTN